MSRPSESLHVLLTMLSSDKLRPDTRAVWNAFDGHPLLKGFVLIGGTALTLRIGHRVSEDLDLAYTERKLPKVQIAALVKHLAGMGVDMRLMQNPLDEEEFFNSGLDLADYQQNFIVYPNDPAEQGGGVKVSLVCYDPPMGEFIKSQPDDALRVATVGEIFETKAWVCSERSKTRDWVDMYTLIHHHGYSFDDMRAVFSRLNRLAAFNNAASRLRLAAPGAADEGYLSLMADAPSLDEMRAFFNEGLDALELKLAKAAFIGKSLG